MGGWPVGCLESVEELNSEPPKTNPSSGRTSGLQVLRPTTRPRSPPKMHSILIYGYQSYLGAFWEARFRDRRWKLKCESQQSDDLTQCECCDRGVEELRLSNTNVPTATETMTLNEMYHIFLVFSCHDVTCVATSASQQVCQLFPNNSLWVFLKKQAPSYASAIFSNSY